jgi:hypothetical protein
MTFKSETMKRAATYAANKVNAYGNAWTTPSNLKGANVVVTTTVSGKEKEASGQMPRKKVA